MKTTSETDIEKVDPPPQTIRWLILFMYSLYS